MTTTTTTPQTSRRWINLTNDFHGTIYRVHAHDDGRGLWISFEQWNRARAKLCGYSGCECGELRGCKRYIAEDYTAGRVWLESYEETRQFRDD